MSSQGRKRKTETPLSVASSKSVAAVETRRRHIRNSTDDRTYTQEYTRPVFCGDPEADEEEENIHGGEKARSQTARIWGKVTVARNETSCREMLVPKCLTVRFAARERSSLAVAPFQANSAVVFQGKRRLDERPYFSLESISRFYTETCVLRLLRQG